MNKKIYIKPVLHEQGTIEELTKTIKTEMDVGDGVIYRGPSGDIEIGNIS